MILVSFSTAFFLYLMIPIMVIFILWLSMEYKNQTLSTKPESKDTLTCSICFQSFLYNRSENIVRCPFCQSLNDVSEIKS
ncbi:MAG: hypothetical protein JW774_11120 [Candidatus Aureabacteria bacterium]|nr:hypothetical protein [Candidatus Auribacterota bacterium]